MPRERGQGVILAKISKRGSMVVMGPREEAVNG
jgi:hypothetical protein